MAIDPASALELAKMLFAGISAAAAAINVWQKSRDSKQAAKSFDKTLTTVRESPSARLAAQELVHIIPHEVLSDLEGRADLCWTGYRAVLGGDYLPAEIDRAT